MSYIRTELKPYTDRWATLIPVHTWNKRINGDERGKTPIHSDWTKRNYVLGDVPKWLDSGFNLGYRIPENEAVVDLDPRNYDGVDCSQLVAELFGYFDIEELCENMPVVKTGGGGYHIYCLLPDGANYQNFRETVEELPGVELKRKGRQVLAAGSKHPSGKHYKWINQAEPKEISFELEEVFYRKLTPKKEGEQNGRGIINGSQLTDMVLDKLDPYEFNTNDSWWPLLCGSHHATDGQGIDEFVAWSLKDEQYENCENQIRARWESLSEEDSGNTITIGSLIHRLEQTGTDTSGLKVVLSFSNLPDLDDFDDLDGDDENEEAALLKEAQEIADDIEIGDMYELPEEEAGVEGKALSMANELHAASSNEDIMKVMRLIKAADLFESTKAQEVIVAKKIMKTASLNKILRSLDAKIIDDLALLVSQKTLEKTFNKARHLTCPPNGMLWAFHKTHWRPMSDEFLSRMVQNIIHVLKKKMDIEANELSLIQQAVRLTRIQVSTLNDRIHRTGLPHSVVNCMNGELWLKEDGGHELRKHNYRSYLLNCLKVDYDPSAECPLFMGTIHEIFAKFPDTDDMVRHMGEIMGYMIQPKKNIASWWLFRGPGGDGKSTLLKVIEGILGDAMLMSTVKLLGAGSTSGNNHAINSLVGKLCVAIEELPSSTMLKDEGVKMFSENTKMEANPKSKDAYSFMYGGGLIMCANTPPATRDLSRGMIRRANVIPFNQQFDADGRDDIDRASKILNNEKEMAGVLNFMLAGLQRLRNRGRFKPPVSCADAKAEWLGEANNIIRFLNDTVVQTKNQLDCIGDLNSLYGMIYQGWCEENGIEEGHRKKKHTFMKDLQGLGWVVKKGGGNIMKVYGGKLLDLDGGVDDNIDSLLMDTEENEEW